MPKKLSKEIFVEKARIIHGNKYDYSKSNYTKGSEKIKIICLKHGEFTIRANAHVNKQSQGCKTCGNEIISKIKISDFNTFAEKSKIIHNNKYDYSLVEYVNSKLPVKIICPKHGVFEQIPKRHTMGCGCQICANNKKYNNDSFIKKALEIHGNKYDYSLVRYKNKRSKVKIICKEHGEFEQEAGSHIRTKGSGCPNCNESKGEIKVKKFLEKKSIKFIRQKTFDECKNINLLPFDFYLPDFNICIEYDGEQHYKPIKHLGGNKYLKKQIFIDEIKNNFCIIKKIKLIRIKYDEDVDLFLGKIF